MPAVVFSMENEFNELLVEERRNPEPGKPPTLLFPAIIMYQFEPYVPAMMRGLRSAFGVTLVRAQQLFPENFLGTEGGPLWYADVDQNQYSIYAFFVYKWVGEVLPERVDTHAKLRWASVTDILSDGTRPTQIMAQVISQRPR